MHTHTACRVEPLENRIAPALIAAFNVSQLVGRNGFVTGGAGAADHAGSSIANIGDFNGDGLDDFIIGAPDAEGGGTGRGAAYIVLGSLDTTASPLPLASPDGTRVIAILGEADGDAFGTAVAGAGDVNGDGFVDVIVGAPNVKVSNFRVGAAYVIYGHSGAFPATIDLAAPPSGYGFRVAGFGAGDETGSSVAGAGDVNGDGKADIIIGARDHSFGASPGEGGAYVLFGAASFNAQINASTINGTNGFIIAGTQADADWGYSVAGVGDFNGDGYGDVAIGAPGYDDPATSGVDNGQVAVIYGHGGTFSGTFNIASITGADGFRVTGATPGSNAGFSIAGAGDFSGDEKSDLIIGAPHSAPDSPIGRGAAYFLYGGSVSSATDFFNIATIQSSQGFVFLGAKKADGTGFSVSTAGDLNADGLKDIIIGTAPNLGNLSDQPGNGGDNAFVLFGQSTPSKALVQASQLNGSNGLIIFPQRHSVGFASAVSGGGDYNGDGFADLLIGAPNDVVTGLGAGAVFTLFGSQHVGDTKAFDPKRFEFVDHDGDIVTVKINKGELPREAFQLKAATSGTGFTLSKVDLTGSAAEFVNGKLTISVEPAAPAMAKRLARGGVADDGTIDVGEVDATGINLKELNINGDVYIVHAGMDPAGAGASLKTGEATTPGISLFKALSIGQSATYSMLGASLDVPNGVKEMKVTGDIDSLTAELTGRLTKLVVGGQIRNTTMNVNGSITTLKAKNGIENTTVNVSLGLKSFSVTGDVTMSTIRVGQTLKTFHVTGDFSDSQITAPGTDKKTKVFGTIRIDGDFLRSRILAGYDSGGVATNGDAGIGSVKIGGNFQESLIVAGVGDGGDGFFNGNDVLNSTIGGVSTSIVAKIASIKITGTIDGTMGGSDHFGIIAEQIGSLTVGGVAQGLTPGAGNDLFPGLLLGTTGDVYAVEVNS